MSISSVQRFEGLKRNSEHGNFMYQSIHKVHEISGKSLSLNTMSLIKINRQNVGIHVLYLQLLPVFLVYLPQVSVQSWLGVKRLFAPGNRTLVLVWSAMNGLDMH